MHRHNVYICSHRLGDLLRYTLYTVTYYQVSINIDLIPNSNMCVHYKMRWDHQQRFTCTSMLLLLLIHCWLRAMKITDVCQGRTVTMQPYIDREILLDQYQSVNMSQIDWRGPSSNRVMSNCVQCTNSRQIATQLISMFNPFPDEQLNFLGILPEQVCHFSSLSIFCLGCKTSIRRGARRLIVLHPKQNIESELKWQTC